MKRDRTDGIVGHCRYPAAGYRGSASGVGVCHSLLSRPRPIGMRQMVGHAILSRFGEDRPVVIGSHGSSDTMTVTPGSGPIDKAATSAGSVVRSGRYRWYVLAVLTFAQGCHALDRSVIGLVLEPVKREFLLSDRQAGILAGLSYGIAFAIAAIPFGMAVDRFNRRNLLVMALSFWSGFTLLCGLVNSYLALLFARSAVGAAEAGGTPTGMSLLTDYFRPAERASAVGIWYMSAGAGTLLAFSIGGYVAQHFGWRWVFIVGGLPGIMVALLLLLTVREPLRGGMDDAAPVTAVSTAEQLGIGQKLALIARAPGLVHCILGLVLAAVGSSGIIAWVTPLLLRLHGMPIATAGVIVAVCIGLASSLGAGAAGVLVDTINKRRGFSVQRSAQFAAVMPILSTLFGAIAFLSPSTGVSVVFLILLGVVIAAYNGPANGLVVTVSDKRVRGLSVAIMQFGANLVGFGLGPVFIGEVSEALGGGLALRWGLVAVLGFYLWAALHFLLAGSALRRHALR